MFPRPGADYGRRVAFPRTTLAAIVTVVLAVTAGARPRCGERIVFGLACVGERASATATLCFEEDARCTGSGVVVAVLGPGAPFGVREIRIEGPHGPRVVDALPAALAPGETMVAELEAVLSAPGRETGRLEWIAVGTDGGRGKEDESDGACRVELEASAPACDDAIACTIDTCEPIRGCVHAADDAACGGGDACTTAVCDPTRGCVETRLSGPACDDGDACTSGDRCVAGRCRGGGPVACADGLPCTDDLCERERGCVHRPVDSRCGAGPCATGTCDPVLGCVEVPSTGPGCDDGDPCTTGDHCVAGRCAGAPLTCADVFACTVDACVGGVCRHLPVDARCDGGQCVLSACRPGTPGSDARGCVGIGSGEGEACTDDGFACTEDVCTARGCLHVPIDSRCGPGDCTAAACAPERADGDVDGCVAGPPLAEGECAEDGDPCSDDFCRAGRCEHVPVPDATLCAPVRRAHRQALGLSAGARQLVAALAGAAASPAAPVPRSLAAGLADRLVLVAEDLDAVVRILAGKPGGTVPVSPRARDGRRETPAQFRARAALAQMRAAPRQVYGFVQAMGSTQGRAALGVETARDLGHRGRRLLLGTKTLKAELRRLQRVYRTFAR
jgi:hypothetical protein